MKISLLFSIAIFGFVLTTMAQNKPLPQKLYTTLHDSTTSIDVVMTQGKNGSLSLDGRNVRLFSNYFENTTAQKTTAHQAGFIMWLINGREFISGNIYLGDSTGYIVFNKEGIEYVNRISKEGNTFFQGQIKN